MNILFIAPLPPPINGNSLATKILLDELVKNNEVKTVNLTGGSLKSGKFSLSRSLQLAAVFKAVFQKKTNADIVYFSISESTAGNLKDIIIYLICFRKLSKMIIHLHGGAGMKLIMAEKKNMLYKLNKFFVSRMGAVIVLGETLQPIYCDIAAKQKIHTVPNFAEDFLFLEEDVKNKYEDLSVLKILFLSNLIEGKGHLELLDAFLLMDQNTQKGVSIDFAGAFESEEKKDTFLQKMEGYHQLRYHGSVGGEKKLALFRNAHVFCLPTYYPFEGQPISILEAYATGCAVITTNHSGIPDIFKDKINGFLVDAKSVLALKELLLVIFEKKHLLLPIAIANKELALKNYRTSSHLKAMLKIFHAIK